MSWSTRRKLLYFLAVLLAVLAITSYKLYPVLKENPTCTDQKQNGTELGVDCGGICANLCSSQVYPLTVLWTRAFMAAPGVYDVLAFAENNNIDSGIPKLLYRFKLYDDQNVLIAERDGKTYIGPNQSSAILETQIKTGQSIPKRVFLEIEDGYNWVKTDPRFVKISLSVKNKDLTNASSSPRLSASVLNNSLTDLSGVEVAVILRDAEENAIAVSGTMIDRLSKRGEENITFTWLKPFFGEVSRIEIIPRVNPFAVSY